MLSSLIVLSFQVSFGQKTGAYVFARTPHLLNIHFKNADISYSQGLSTGVGFFHQNKFLELGTFILEGDSYGYYTFFGSTINSNDLGTSFKLNTNWFGEVTSIPSQQEQTDPFWIFTSGVCLFPNMQLQKFNIGVPLCFGVAYDQDSFSFNGRLIFNLSYNIY